MNTQEKHIFALVDCNNFYASCERVFNPALANLPVVILSNNDGCAIAMSNEAKSLGIKIGTPFFKLQKLINENGVRIFSSNYSLYGDLSQRVMDTLSAFTPEIEVYSIDEAFLSLDDFTIDLDSYGREIRSTVKQHTGIPVSVGIARTKTLAKLANRTAKKNKILNGVLDLSSLPEATIDKYLNIFSVSDIWGIGEQNTKKLNNAGIYTALQLKNCSDLWVQNNLGGVVGLRTVWELRGISCIDLESARPDKKAIISSRSFGSPVENLLDLEESVADYVSRAAVKLRKQNCLAGNLQVYLATNYFKPNDAQYSNSASMLLANPTDYTPDLVHHAITLLRRIYQSGFKFKKTGVMLTDIRPKQNMQPDLFQYENGDKKEAVMQVFDAINQRYGKAMIKSGAAGINQQWQMRREYLSNRFTTSWQGLLKIKI